MTWQEQEEMEKLGIFLNWRAVQHLGFATPRNPGVGGGGRPRKPDGAAIRFALDKDATITVTGLSKESLATLARLDAAKWPVVFSVHVQRPGKATEGQPAVLGTARIDKDILRFTPRFPLTPGVRYSVTLTLPGGKHVETTLSLPKTDRKPSANVANVFPSGDKLPENLLKFYIHFSAPMDRGNSYRHIELLDDKGKAVELPFLELDQELWNPEGTRLTLFLDPGRVKRGLKPREDSGPALEEGNRYTLVIGRAWKDAEGTPLKEGFRKRFSVTAPDTTQPDPKTWKLVAPAGAAALKVTFPEPMDRALLERMLWVVDARGKAVPGKFAVEAKETVWAFTPTRAWKPGKYHLVADTRLEDRSGNSIGRPFEVDLARPVEPKVVAKTVRLPFAVE
jgi:hypothetical protein